MNELSVEELTENKVKEVLEYETEVMTEQKARTFAAKVQQAKIGMTFNRDRNQNKRIEQGQILRIITMITTDPKEREKYIKSSMPKLLTEKK
jgi:thymidylate synthase